MPFLPFLLLKQDKRSSFLERNRIATKLPFHKKYINRISFYFGVFFGAAVPEHNRNGSSWWYNTSSCQHLLLLFVIILFILLLHIFRSFFGWKFSDEEGRLLEKKNYSVFFPFFLLLFRACPNNNSGLHTDQITILFSKTLKQKKTSRQKIRKTGLSLSIFKWRCTRFLAVYVTNLINKTTSFLPF